MYYKVIIWALSKNHNLSLAGGTAYLEAGSWSRQPKKGDCLAVSNCYCVLPYWLITFLIIKPRRQDQCNWSWSQSKIPGFWEKAQIIRAFMAWLPLQTKSTCLITNVCKIRKYIQTNTRYTINTWDQVILSDWFYETLPKAQQTHALIASIENKTKLA